MLLHALRKSLYSHNGTTCKRYFNCRVCFCLFSVGLAQHILTLSFLMTSTSPFLVGSYEEAKLTDLFNRSDQLGDVFLIWKCVVPTRTKTTKTKNLREFTKKLVKVVACWLGSDVAIFRYVPKCLGPFQFLNFFCGGDLGVESSMSCTKKRTYVPVNIVALLEWLNSQDD